MRKWIHGIVVFTACVSAVHAADVMQLDPPEIAKQEQWLVFNGGMELGEPGKPAPGYFATTYFSRNKGYKQPERIYAPVIRREASGNQYLEMPGFQGLVEYNLYASGFNLPRNGEVEISFKAKSIPGEDGSVSNQPGVVLDFRCFNYATQHGVVKDRYPVLESRTFNPGKEWQSYSYKIPVRGNFPYAVMFRVFSRNTAAGVNGLCIDDLKIRYADTPATVYNEASITCGRYLKVFHPGEEIELKVQALLRGAGDSPELSLCIRSDYFLKNIETLKVMLNRDAGYKSADDRSLYTGTVKYSPKQYGSFNTVAMLDNKPVFSSGGDFAALHELDKSVSPLRRQLGGHFRVIGSTYQLTPSNDWAVVIRQGIDLEAQLYALCGFGHAMVSFDLKKVQSDPDNLDFSIPDAEYGVLNKYGIEMIPSLGAWWIYTGRRNNGGVQISPMPGWFFDDKYTRHSLDKDSPDREPRTLKDEVWKLHVDEAVKHFGGRVNKWMLLVEPQWVLKPEDYLILQKIAWEAVKQQNPKSLLIAGDATSDVGNNLLGWTEKMHSLGFEKYLDCVSFNPYESSLDNINGVLFRYSDLIAKLRKTVVPGTQLWEQELYFIANSKRRQHPGQQDVFSAGDVQRHYLLGLLNGLRGITAIPSTSISKNRDELGANDILAGLNSLSFFLDGKVAVLPQKLSNKLLHCAIFTDKTGENCSAVIWSFRPGGMTMKVPAVDGVKLYDCFGNELHGSGIELAADPVFATGSKAVLAQLFSKAEFITPDPVKLYARTFGGMTFLEAENLSGSRSITMVDFDGQTAPVQFYFKDSDYLRMKIKGKLEQPGFKSGLKGESGLQSGSIAVSVNSGEFTIPAGENSALKLQMNDGSKLALWTENGRLWIKAEVGDPAVTPAADNNLYTGDALEMFVDRAPFNRIGRNEFGGMNIPELDVRQYIFAAAPSATGRSMQIINASSGREVESGATLKQEKTAGGYALLASLPLAEIAPSADGGGIVGMNFELSKKDGGSAGSKAMLIPSKFPSYKYRSHYPLFQINALNGADMLCGAKWKSSLDGILKKVSAYEVKESFDAESGVKVEILEEPSWGPTVRRGAVSVQGINLPAGNYLLEFYARGDKISEMKVALSKARKEFKGGDLPVSDRWTRYEIPFSIKEADPKGFVYMEFHAPRRDQGCTAVISGMKLYKTDPVENK